MKALKLVIEYDYDCLHLLGIISSMKDYTLAWNLNKIFNLNFRKEEDLRYDSAKGGYFFISNFIFETEFSTFRLLKNRATEFVNTLKPFIAPEIKHYDYIFVIESEDGVEIEGFKSKIKFINNIELVTVVDCQELESKSNFLL